MSAAADKAVEYLLQRIKYDGRLAYHFGMTESLDLLCAAYAEAHGLDAEQFRTQFNAELQPEPPRCRSGECVEQSQGGRAA